jgi:hypothetical protein
MLVPASSLSCSERGHGAPEAAAYADLAVDTALAAHQFDQLTGDGQAEPRSAVLAGGGRVGLGEGVEDACRLFSIEADSGVVHLQVKSCRVPLGWIDCRGDHDQAVGREFDGIPEQVGEHLTDPARVATHDGGHVVADGGHQLQSFGVGLAGEQLGHVLDQRGDIEVDVLEIEAAGLDLGEVEDVVQDCHQRITATVDCLGVFALAGVELGGQQQLRHAQHAVHRRADLVAHVGEEVRLQERRLNCTVTCPLQLRSGLLTQADVGAD